VEIRRISLADTIRNIEARPVDRKAVEALAESMNRLGLLNPITVYPTTYASRGKADNPGWGIAAGHHRFEAAKMLGWEEIDAFVVEAASEITTRRLIEISENLHRAELTALERDKLVAEWVELTGGVSSQLDTKLGRPESGARKAARDLGLEKMDVHRALKVASLSPEAQDAAREIGLDDNRAALLEARKQPTPEAQVESLRRRAEVKLAPLVMDDFAIIQKQKAALIKAWESARPEARNEFLKEIGER
jgi:ParB/RepB/Spo0J family partition protein